jgi:hypothetical protein
MRRHLTLCDWSMSCVILNDAFAFLTSPSCIHMVTVPWSCPHVVSWSSTHVVS